MYTDSVKVKNGTFDLGLVQYHVANVMAKTISPKADAKNNNQHAPKTLITTK